MSDVRVDHNSANHRYELYVGDELASVAEYRPVDGRWDFHHTETLDAFRGQGLAARVVRWALDDVRSRGVTIAATCWFVADFIDAHQEYADLLEVSRS